MTPVLGAFYASLFTYGMTALGASLVFLFRRVNQSVMNSMAGLAAGVMIAASFFSLLAPSADYAQQAGIPPWIATVGGFFAGCLLLFLIDKLVPHHHPVTKRTEGARSSMGRASLMMLAMTIHNVPEGVAIGVAFGAAALGGEAGIGSALALAIGIGIQNLPEGSVVSLGMLGDGSTKRRAFVLGQFSGLVEIPSAVAGALLVSAFRPILPFMLSLAAGSMIYVVVNELIPEAHMDGKKPMVTVMLLIGFMIMMGLDVGLG